jgi:phosphotransferase system  glucose/maltose/N-acetylglucosamine-specific IIC component
MKMKDNDINDVGGCLLGLMFMSSFVLAIVKLEWYLDFSWWWVFVPIIVPALAMLIAVVYVELEIGLADMAKKQVEKEEKLKKQK